MRLTALWAFLASAGAAALSAKGGERMNPLFAKLAELRAFRHVPELVRTVEETPPKPLQIFETGPKTRKEWAQNKEKYKYQYVCLLDREGGGNWYVRRAPRIWFRHPPFHTRIIRPSFPGMLHYLLSHGKVEIKIEEIEVPTRGGGRRKVKHHRLVEAGKE